MSILKWTYWFEKGIPSNLNNTNSVTRLKRKTFLHSHEAFVPLAEI